MGAPQGTARPSADYFKAFDTVTLRLKQASGIVTTLMNNFTEGHSTVSDEVMIDTLSAIDALLDQAHDACKLLHEAKFTPPAESE